MTSPLGFLILNFGAPIFFGYVGDPILAPVLLAVGVAIYNVVTGWRARTYGVIVSILIGVLFSLVVAIPLYFIGAWAGGKL